MGQNISCLWPKVCMSPPQPNHMNQALPSNTPTLTLGEMNKTEEIKGIYEASSAILLPTYLTYTTERAIAIKVLIVIYQMCPMVSMGQLALIVVGSQSVKGMRKIKALIGLGLWLYIVGFPLHLFVIVPDSMVGMVSLNCGVATLMGFVMLFISIYF